MYYKWYFLLDVLMQAFFLCGFPVGGSVKNHRTIEFLSNFLEFFGDFLEFLGKIVGFLLSFQWKFMFIIEKSLNFVHICSFVLHFYLERSNFLDSRHNFWVFVTEAWVFPRKFVWNHRNIEFCTWKPLSFFQRLSFFRLEFLRKRTKKSLM